MNTANLRAAIAGLRAMGPFVAAFQQMVEADAKCAAFQERAEKAEARVAELTEKGDDYDALFAQHTDLSHKHNIAQELDAHREVATMRAKFEARSLRSQLAAARDELERERQEGRRVHVALRQALLLAADRQRASEPAAITSQPAHEPPPASGGAP